MITTPSKINDIIEEARNGRMFILADDEDRENEGDLIIPAANGYARGNKFYGYLWARFNMLIFN